jgi:hypothetical protein
VPSAVATAVASAAILMLSASDVHMPGGAHGCSQLSSVNWLNV